MGNLVHSIVNDRYHVARLEFELETLLWPGGYNGKTFSCGDNSCLGPFLPGSGQLVGRARWLLRTILAGYGVVGEGSNSGGRGGATIRIGHRHVEWHVARVFGSTSHASNYSVRVSWYIGQDPVVPSAGLEAHQRYETITMDDAQAISRVLAEVSMDSSRSDLKPSHVYGALATRAYEKLREHLGINDPARVDSESEIAQILQKINDTNSQIGDRALLLFSIPRFFLAIQKARKLHNIRHYESIRHNIYEIQPLYPSNGRRLRLVVDVYRRPGSPRDDRLDSLAVGSLALTPVLAGLGKATSRGFGHFKLSSYEIGPAGGIIEGVQDGLDMLRTQLNKDAVKALLDAIASASHNGRRDGAQNDADAGRVYLLPRINPDKPIDVISDPRHPCPYHITELPGLLRDRDNQCFSNSRACSSIGDEYARLVCYLSAIGSVTLKSTWKAYHVIEHDYNRQRGVKSPGVAYHTWVLGLPRNIKRRRGSHSQVVGYLYAKQRENETTNTYIRDKPVRHLSPFFLWPDAESNAVILLEFDSLGSLGELISESTSRRDEDSSVLVHIGRHSRRLDNGRRIIIIHSVKVSYAMSRNRLRFESRFESGGIAKPGELPGRYVSSRVGDVVGAAREWILELLGRRDGGS